MATIMENLKQRILKWMQSLTQVKYKRSVRKLIVECADQGGDPDLLVAMCNIIQPVQGHSTLYPCSGFLVLTEREEKEQKNMPSLKICHSENTVYR